MNRASVQSIDSLKTFRVSLWKFAELANRALNDAEAEVQRALVWLETEQRSYWRGQVQKRSELVTRAREAVLAKKLYANVDGTRQTAIEEEKALKVAVLRLEEAREKSDNVRRWLPRLQKEALLYRGVAQRLSHLVQQEIPAAVNHLDNLISSLEAYVGLAPAGAAPASPEPAAWDGEAGMPSMACGEPPISEAPEVVPAPPPDAAPPSGPTEDR